MPSIGFWINNWVVLYLKDGTAGAWRDGLEGGRCLSQSQWRKSSPTLLSLSPCPVSVASCLLLTTTSNRTSRRYNDNRKRKAKSDCPRMAARAADAADAAAVPPWWRATWAVSPMRQSWHWNRSTWYNYRRKVATPSPSAGCGSRAKTNIFCLTLCPQHLRKVLRDRMKNT